MPCMTTTSRSADIDLSTPPCYPPCSRLLVHDVTASQMGHIASYDKKKGSTKLLAEDFLYNLTGDYAMELIQDTYMDHGDEDEGEADYDYAIQSYRASLKFIPAFARASLHMGMDRSTVLSEFMGPER